MTPEQAAMIRLAERTKGATDDASAEYWREIARVLAVGVLDFARERMSAELRSAIERLVNAKGDDIAYHGRLMELINAVTFAYLGKEEYARRLQEAMRWR